MCLGTLIAYLSMTMWHPLALIATRCTCFAKRHEITLRHCFGSVPNASTVDPVSTRGFLGIVDRQVEDHRQHQLQLQRLQRRLHQLQLLLLRACLLRQRIRSLLLRHSTRLQTRTTRPRLFRLFLQDLCRCPRLHRPRLHRRLPLLFLRPWYLPERARNRTQ